MQNNQSVTTKTQLEQKRDKETARLVDVFLQQYEEKIENGDAENNCDDIKFREVVKVLQSIKTRVF